MKMKLSVYHVNKFLAAHCEKVNPNDRNSEWQLIRNGAENDVDESDEAV